MESTVPTFESFKAGQYYFVQNKKDTPARQDELENLIAPDVDGEVWPLRDSNHLVFKGDSDQAKQVSMLQDVIVINIPKIIFKAFVGWS